MSLDETHQRVLQAIEQTLKKMRDEYATLLHAREQDLRLMRAVVQAGNVKELTKAISDMAERLRK